MSDEGALADPMRCPSCESPLDGSPVCRWCGLALTGADAQRLWELSQQAASLLAERRALIARMRAAAPGAPVPAAPLGGPAPSVATGPVGAPGAVARALPTQGGPGTWTAPGPPGPAAGGVPGASPGWPPAGMPPAKPRPEWTRHRVQNLLLVLGVLLLGVAAVIFVAVSWGSLGVGARTALLAAVTVVAGAATWWTSRRDLPASTEALAVLTTALVLLDGYGLRRTGVAALDRPDGPVYWAVVLAVVAVGATLAVAAIGTVTFQLVAVVTGLLPALLVGQHLGDRGLGTTEHAAAWFALGSLVDAALVAAVAPALPRPRARVAQVVALVALVPLWTLLGVVPAIGDAFDTGHSGLPGALLLLGFAVVATAVGLRPPLHGHRVAAGATTAAAATATVLAAWAAPADIWSGEDALPAALGLTAVLVLAVVVLGSRVRPIPRPRLLVGAGVVTTFAVAPVLAVAEQLVRVVGGGAQDRVDVWSERASTSTRLAAAWTWTEGRTPPLLLAGIAAAALLMALVAGRLAIGAALALPVLGLAVAATGVALDLDLWVGVGLDVAVAVALLVLALWAARAGREELGRTALTSGAALAAVGTAWAFLSAGLTVVVLPLVAVSSALLALAPMSLPPTAHRGLEREQRVVTAVLAIAGTLAAVGTISRYAGAGWPQVWTTTVAVALLIALTGYVLLPRAREPFLAVAVVLAGVLAATIAWWSGAPEAWRGFAVAATVSVLAALIAWLPTFDRDHERLVGLVASAAVAVPALTVSAVDADVAWLALLVTGVASAAVALRPGLGQVRWLAVALLTGSSWVRLAIADVRAPEAYTVPPAIVLLALAWWQRRSTPHYSSWRAYGAGLTLALVPSLARAVTDPGSTRPLLLGAAALAVLLVGVARRLQAPLVLGALVLAVDAIVQLAPYLADLYDAVPRWVSIGAAGLLLLGLGATFEQRVRDVRRVRDRLAGLR